MGPFVPLEGATSVDTASCGATSLKFRWKFRWKFRCFCFFGTIPTIPVL